MRTGDFYPGIDIAFKKIFGVKDNNDLLISFINSVVSDEDRVKEVTLVSPYNLQSFNEDWLSVLDMKAIGHSGKHFNIEIQIPSADGYDQKALYHWAKLYTKQQGNVESLRSLVKTIGIHILNFTLMYRIESYHNVFCIMDKGTKTCEFNDLELHTIELRQV